jgi:hypothetical protein
MPKNSVYDWSATPDNNQDVAGIGILGINPVSNFDQAMRTIMSQIKVQFDDVKQVPSRAYAIASYHPYTAPDFIRTAGYASAGDRGEALYKKVASEPTHAGKFSITTLASATVWYEFAESEVNLFQLGAKGDSTPFTTGSGTDDTTAWNNTASVAAALRIPMKIPSLASNKAFRLTARTDYAQELTIKGDGADVTTGLTANYPDGGAWVYLDHLGEGFYFRDDANVGASKKFARMKGFGVVRNQATPGVGWTPTAASHDVRVEYNVDMEDMLFLSSSKIALIRSAGQLQTRRVRGQPLVVGYECERSSDVQRWDGDHWWPYWSQDTNVKNYTITNAKCFSVRRADGLMITNPFGIWYKRVFYAEDVSGDGSGLANFHITNLYADIGGGGIEIVSNYYPAYGTITGYLCNSSVDGSPSEGAAFRLSGSVASQIDLVGIRSNRSPAEVIYVSGAAHVVKVLPGRFNGWAFVTSGRYMVRASDGASIQFMADPEYTTGNSLYYLYDATSKIELPNGCVKKTITVASDAITVPGRGSFLIDTEGGAATDDLITINGGKDGDIIVLSTASGARDVTLRDTGGNLFLAGDFTLANNVSKITLLNVSGIQWHEISRSTN